MRFLSIPHFPDYLSVAIRFEFRMTFGGTAKKERADAIINMISMKMPKDIN